MKLFNHKGVVQKIIISLMVVILISFSVPVKVHASFGGKLMEPIMNLVISLADVVQGALQGNLVGTKQWYGSVALDGDDGNFQEGGIWYADESTYKNAKVKVSATSDVEDTSHDLILNNKRSWYNPAKWFAGDENLAFPNILYCPEYIFSNNIALLDADFVNPSTYKDAQGQETTSISSKLRDTVSSWYKAFRNIAIVGLLSVLVYTGIRILIGSTAGDKAKYKERLKDWLVGLCLVFAMHYIMAGTMMLTEKITDLISDTISSDVIVKIDGYDEDEVRKAWNI